MGRSRYKIVEPTHPHFLTSTVSHWLPTFTNTQSVQIVIDSLEYLKKSDNLTIFAYVILENHLHLVASSDDINKTMQKFKSYSAYELLKLLQKNNATTLLRQFAFCSLRSSSFVMPHWSLLPQVSYNYPYLLKVTILLINTVYY